MTEHTHTQVWVLGSCLKKKNEDILYELVWIISQIYFKLEKKMKVQKSDYSIVPFALERRGMEK